MLTVCLCWHNRLSLAHTNKEHLDYSRNCWKTRAKSVKASLSYSGQTRWWHRKIEDPQDSADLPFWKLDTSLIYDIWSPESRYHPVMARCSSIIWHKKPRTWKSLLIGGPVPKMAQKINISMVKEVATNQETTIQKSVFSDQRDSPKIELHSGKQD